MIRRFLTWYWSSLGGLFIDFVIAMIVLCAGLALLAWLGGGL